MKTDELSLFGFPNTLVDIWRREMGETLLPVQERALREFNVHERASGNLLVIAPTSAGKTFVGELAAVRTALERRRSIFLVPYRALAEEQFAVFSRRYEGFGLRVVISDRDHREFDQDIMNGSYDLAVIVYEKLLELLVQRPGILSNCGLVVADEVQMMCDRDRGPTVELLLTRILREKGPTRLVALSAVLSDLSDFDKWLNARVLRIVERPVELREYIYSYNGKCTFREANSRKTGETDFNPWTDREEGLVQLLQSLIDGGGHALVFCGTRDGTVRLAHQLKERLKNTGAAVESIKKANELTVRSTREELQDLFQAGVSYHNSDLAYEERSLIEDGFRRGDLRVIACTSTLAMGINVPARFTVVYDTELYRGSAKGKVPLSVAEYKNMVGRAGRYGSKDPYGCSFLLASTDVDVERLRQNYVDGELERFESRFGDQLIDSQVLTIVALGLAESLEEVEDYILATYNGVHRWQSDIAKAEIQKMVADAIKRCQSASAISQDATGKLKCTHIGKLCAIGGYQLGHLQHVRNYLEKYREDVPVSVLYWALRTDFETGEQAYSIPKLRTADYRSGKYQRILVELANAEPAGPALKPLVDWPHRVDYYECVSLRRCLASYAWISNIPIKQIEKQFQGVAVGAIRNTAEVCAWIISLLKEVAKAEAAHAERAVAFEELVERLEYGSTAGALGLCRIKNSGLSRDERNELAERGIRGVDDLLSVLPESLPLPRKKATRLLKAAEGMVEGTLLHRRRDQTIRLKTAHCDTALLDALYERDGEALEEAVDELLKSPFCLLPTRRVTRQDEGDPDLLLYDADDRVFAIGVTAKERAKVSMKKAVSIVGQSAKYKPVGYIVIGRPDFERLAIKNAEEQIRHVLNYKLFPMDSLCELYVLFREERITADDVSRILVERNSYVSYEYVHGLG